MQTKSIEVIFKRHPMQWLINLFRPKAKRFPKVATFTEMSGYRLTASGLMVVWGKSSYFYPLSKIERVKFVKH